MKLWKYKVMMTRYTIFTAFAVYNPSMFGTANNDSILGLSQIFYFYAHKSLLYYVFSSSMYAAGTLQFHRLFPGIINRIIQIIH